MDANMFFFSAIVLINLIGIFVAGEPTAVINTTTGPVQGETYVTVHSVPFAAFKGIRYAKAPLGHLRFKPPVPVDPWTETLNATVEGDVCPQIDAVTNVYVGSEDCLFLNVFTPVTNLSQTPTTLKSVMVWIYGGSFVFGSSSTKINRPDFLLERDVVFVNLNYRLGALGFLSLNHPNATGNAGLKDQNLALKWVQANIEKFGGNPNNVTIFGESAGAVSVSFHVLSDASAGLFHGAIAMSGTPLVPWGFVTHSVAEARAVRLGGLLGTATLDKDTLLKTFYAATPENFVNLASSINPIVPFVPTLEDASIATDVFIAKCTIEKYQSGNFSKVPQIIGFMEQETIAFLGFLDIFLELVDETMDATDGVEGVSSESLSEVHDYGEISSINSANSAGLASVNSANSSGLRSIDSTGVGTANLALPNLSKLIGNVANGVLETVVNLTTDALFKAQIDQTQRILAHRSNNPVYYYDITYYNNRSRHNLDSDDALDGAGHADDIAYIFYIPSANYSLDLDDSMGLTIYRVSTMWTNFAKYGDPTPHWVDQYPLNITWPDSGSLGRALQIGHELTIVPRPISPTADIIELALGRLLPITNDCQFGGPTSGLRSNLLVENTVGPINPRSRPIAQINKI